MLEPNLESFDIYQKFEESEIALHKLQLENAKKNSEIIKLKEELQQYKMNITNTSTSFPWPEEFKCQWETLIKTMIMDTFENVSFNTILFMRTINIIIKLIYEISKVKIKEKIIELLKCLNIKIKSDETIKKFFNKYQKILFQNYFSSLFTINNELINKIIAQIKNEFLKKYKKYFLEEELNDIMNDLSSKNINSFIKELYHLCLYMNINIPTLTIKTSVEANYRYFNKNEYINIEGFANDGDICIIIVNPPSVRPNIAFRGIKPVVYMIDNPSKEIINLCKQQNIEKNRREQSKSFTGSTNNLSFKTANSQNNNNPKKINRTKNNYIVNSNYIKKKQSTLIINGCTSNNTSTNDATTNIEINFIGNNLNNNKIMDNKYYNDLNNNKNYPNNRLNNKLNNNMKMIDIQLNEQQKKLNNNLLYLNKNEYKSKSSNKEAENNKLKGKNNNKIINNYLKGKEYSLTYYTNQKPINKNNNNINNENKNKEYNIVNNRINENSSKTQNINTNNKIYNYTNKIEPYVGSKINYTKKDYINNNEINTYSKNNLNINNNPLMNSNYFELKNNIKENNIFEKSRNNNIKIENKNEFKYNLLNHNNIKNKKDNYRINNKSNNINNKIIITTSDYSKQNSSKNYKNNKNTNSNENHLILSKKNSINKKNNKSLNNNNLYNNLDYRIITPNPLEITDNSNNRILNTKYTMSIHQLTDNSMNNNLANDKNLGRTTIKKISSNNYNLKRIIESNNNLNNRNINSNLSANNKTNLGIVSRIKNISPYDKTNDKRVYANLKYNLSFKKKNIYKNPDTNNNYDNNKLLYNNNLYSDYSYKTQHRTNSNDINMKNRSYITNINGYNYKKENEGIHNHSNLDINILNREFSTSSILSSNSQIKLNKNSKRRDFSNNSNIKNNTYNNDIMQLKTEISERTKSSYFNNKNGIKPINNINFMNNIQNSKKNYIYNNNNSSNRNNIHYTKNYKNTKNIISKKLNFQFNYESNQQKQNNIFVKNQ